MRAVSYLVGYLIALYFDHQEVSAFFFMLLFTSIFLKYTSRAKRWWIRVPLTTLMYPFRIIDYLLVCLWYAPRTLLTLRPYVLLWVMYLAVLDGQFIPEESQKP